MKKKQIKKDQIETIDCTPTWTGILPIYLHFLENDGPTKGKATAIDEMKRMAKAADSYSELWKAFKEFDDQAVEAITTLLRLIDNPSQATTPGNQKILGEIRQLVKDHQDAKTKDTADSN